MVLEFSKFLVSRKKEGLINEQDLAQFTSELLAEGVEEASIETDFFEGSYFEYAMDEEWCRDWFLVTEDILVVAGYTCLLEDKHMDVASVDELVASIAPNLEAED